MEDKGGEPDKVLLEDQHILITVLLYAITVIIILLNFLITLFGFVKTFKRSVLNVFLFGIKHFFEYKQLRSIEMQQFFDDYFISWYGEL